MLLKEQLLSSPFIPLQRGTMTQWVIERVCVQALSLKLTQKPTGLLQSPLEVDTLFIPLWRGQGEEKKKYKSNTNDNTENPFR
jgi:hypothetical protein